VTDTTAQPATETTNPKAEQSQDTAAAADASKITDATPKPTADTTKKTDEPSTDLAGVAAASVAKPVETRKAETKTPSTEPKVAAATAPTAPSPVATDATNTAPKADTSQPTANNIDPDAELTISSKEGLGHEAAAKMADKNDAKAATAQANGPNTPTQAQAAPTASATTQSFAKMVAAASGGEVSSVTTGGNGASGTGALSDLQNVATTTQSQNTNTATVRIGTLPGQTTPTQVPAMTIALQVARNLQKGINRFDIRLDPAEMGRIDVRMEVKKDGSVATHMVVERPETLELLRRDATTLQQALNNAGLQSNSDSLNFSLRDGNAGNQQQNFANNTQGSSGLSNFESSPDNVALSPIYNINTSANGGIDIRV
jgi:flagellar hook-length control protein FliK